MPSPKALLLWVASPPAASTGVTVNRPTVGRIPNGANVERAVVAGMPQTVDTLEVELDRADLRPLSVRPTRRIAPLADRLQLRLTAGPSGFGYRRIIDSARLILCRRFYDF